jgi:hypothetical protein
MAHDMVEQAERPGRSRRTERDQMTLLEPAPVRVEPGQPITAQGWNAIVAGVLALDDAIEAIGRGTLEVSVTAGGDLVTDATIVATPKSGGQSVRGLPLIGTSETYLVPGVNDGEWSVQVSAPGFVTKTENTTVPLLRALVVNLEPAGVRVPDLFGKLLPEALRTVIDNNLDVQVVVDALGKEVPQLDLPADYQNVPVLMQLPAAGTVVDPTTRVRLVVAAAVREEPIVTLPSLVGLSQAEAARALEAVGLRLGKVTFR